MGFLLLNNVLFYGGHYKGVDQRARDLFITRGNILSAIMYWSGGELAAAVLFRYRLLG